MIGKEDELDIVGKVEAEVECEDGLVELGGDNVDTICTGGNIDGLDEVQL